MEMPPEDEHNHRQHAENLVKLGCVVFEIMRAINSSGVGGYLELVG